VPIKDPKRKAEAQRMVNIRKKIREGKRVSQQEKALLASWDDRKRKPGEARALKPPPAKLVEGTAEHPLDDAPPQVHSTLPGEGAKGEGPPPLTVPPESTPGIGDGTTSGPSAGADSAGASAGSTAPGPSPGAGSAGPKSRGPAMTPDEAESGANMAADLCTQIVHELNSYNVNNGGNGFPPDSNFFKMFHFSIKRLAFKYGAAIDEDTYDACVIIGVGGFVGYNSWQTKRRMEKEGKIPPKGQAQQPPKQEQSNNGQRKQPAPNGSAGTTVSAPTNGIRSDASQPVALVPKGKFDPSGYY
jgi:hypothetical protein